MLPTERIPSLVSTRHDTLATHPTMARHIAGTWWRDSIAGPCCRLYQTAGGFVLARCCWIRNAAGGTEGPAPVILEPLTGDRLADLLRTCAASGSTWEPVASAIAGEG